MLPPHSIEQSINRTVREEWGRILASLVKSLSDFQLAEDCLQDAVIVAMDHWQEYGLPDAPAAWLITTARRKAIDRLRRDKNFARHAKQIAYLTDLENTAKTEGQMFMQDAIPDKRLEMIFTCCHPALEEKTKLALTLRTIGGLNTEEIARAFLDKPAAMAQRLVRAKKKIAIAGIPYEVPHKDQMPERLSSVLHVIYLIFNEGYFASSGAQLTNANLCEEAIRLARIVHQLLPERPEVAGLLALLLLHDSRRSQRTNDAGQMIALEHQIRARWDKSKIKQGTDLLKQTLPMGKIGPYQLQAAISAVHAESPSWKQTDWPQIKALYALLYDVQPSPIVQLNQAIAVSYSDSPKAALDILEEIENENALIDYQPFYAAKADLLQRSGKAKAAASFFEKAIALSNSNAEREFLRAKMEQAT